jgi:multidrug efflux pump
VSTKKPPPHQVTHYKVNTTHPILSHPIGLLLLALGLVLAGLLAYRALPVAPLPQVDLPTINVQASLPGASAETMAATVATPLERNLGRIAGLTEITSSSNLGSTSITLQFDLNRKVDDAARDVQAAIQATRPLLPSGMPDTPSIRKVNPADSPIAILALTSPQHSRGQLYDLAATTLAQVLAQVPGVGQVTLGGGALPAVRVDINAQATAAQGLNLENVRRSIAQSSTLRPKGNLEHGDQRFSLHSNSQSTQASDYQQLLLRHNNGHTLTLGNIATVSNSVQDLRAFGQVNSNGR